jgi:cell division protein FtsB
MWWWGPSAARLLRQRVALAMAVATSTALITAVVFGSRGFLHLRTLTAEEHDVGRRIALLLHENEQLRERIHRLRTDDRTLERLAREQLGFTRPGELIYRFGNRPRPGKDDVP